MSAEVPRDVAAWNDELARAHPIDDYYARSPWPIRVIEQRRLRLVEELLGDTVHKRLLEVGAGGGHVLERFPRAVRTAQDVSPVFLETARRRLAGQGVRFLLGELDELGLPDASFDRIVCTEVLEHTVDPERVLAAIARLLAPDGVAVVTIPNDPLILRLKGALRRTPVGWALGNRVEWGGDRYHLHAWTPDAFAEVLRRRFRVTARRASPSDAAPIRVLYRCEPR